MITMMANPTLCLLFVALLPLMTAAYPRPVAQRCESLVWAFTYEDTTYMMTNYGLHEIRETDRRWQPVTNPNPMPVVIKGQTAAATFPCSSMKKCYALFSCSEPRGYQAFYQVGLSARRVDKEVLPDLSDIPVDAAFGSDNDLYLVSGNSYTMVDVRRKSISRSGKLIEFGLPSHVDAIWEHHRNGMMIAVAGDDIYTDRRRNLTPSFAKEYVPNGLSGFYPNIGFDLCPPDRF